MRSMSLRSALLAPPRCAKLVAVVNVTIHPAAQMRRHKSALKAFRQALRLNPNLDGIAETVRAIEASLGGDDRRDEKK